jgi:uncharacterized membrane protein YphA (DoxX/SURF4 family)
MEFSTYSVLFARLLIAAYFIVTGFVYARDWQINVQKLRQAHILLPTPALWSVITLYIVGGSLLIFAYKLNMIATLLIATLLLVNALYHRFWIYVADEYRCMLKKFMVNLALVGAIILVVLTNHS